MKSIVLYFSQTGNTEKVARAIQAGIAQVTASATSRRYGTPTRSASRTMISSGSARR